MDRQQIIAVVSIAVIVIAAVLWLKPFSSDANGYGDNNANLPDGAWYLCGDAACKTEFNLTVAELDAHYQATYGQPNTQPPCPKCSKTASIRADKCKHCGKLSPQNRSSQTCAACGQNVSGK